MSKASDIECALLMRLWTQPINNCNHPEMAGICPNCLARREGSIIDTPHASWCSVKRHVAREEANAADYLISI